MDRQARKLASHREDGSEVGSEVGSNTDSDSEEKVCQHYKRYLILLFCFMSGAVFCLIFLQRVPFVFLGGFCGL